MIINGDCIEEMKKMKSNSVDAVISDPPYNIGFMSKGWDKTGIVNSVEMWEQVFRVLKPGGHILVFNSTRTYHRMVCAIEDAGFEIRDTMSWIYGSGMPHGADVGKQIESKIKNGSANTQAFKKLKGKKATVSMGYNKIHADNDRPKDYNGQEYVRDVEFETEEAKKWNGWNTALKPAQELICVARKPIEEKTVCENVLKYGTGAINIDDCRISHNEPLKTTSRHGRKNAVVMNDKSCGFDNTKNVMASANPKGRFPSNVILDEVSAELLDEQSGHLKSGTNCKRTKEGVFFEHGGLGKAGEVQITYGDEGGASRFFYCAKASKSEKGKYNDHITVKPIKLMEYLVKLITREGQIVLDMFSGSGTTGVACDTLDRKFIGIEKELHYCNIANQRITENHDKK